MAVLLQLQDRNFSSSVAKERLSNSFAFDSFVRKQPSVGESKKRKKKRRLIFRGGSFATFELCCVRPCWIPHGRQVVKKVLQKCHTCRRYRGPPYTMPPMPDLPQECVTPSPPFTYTGVDYFGPLYCTDVSGEGKVWVVLFTCLAIRAIHLEVATDLSADQFLQALRRFISRRGMPRELLSDNAPHFRVADEALTAAWSSAVTDTQVTTYTSPTPVSPGASSPPMLHGWVECMSTWLVR